MKAGVLVSIAIVTALSGAAATAQESTDALAEVIVTATGLKRMLGYDDSLDVFGIHGVGGILGAVLTGVFAVAAIGGEGKNGLLAGNPAQVGIQLWGIAATVVWCAVATFVILLVIRIVMGVRVDEQTEVEGLDVRMHGEVVP